MAIGDAFVIDLFFTLGGLLMVAGLVKYVPIFDALGTPSKLPAWLVPALAAFVPIDLGFSLFDSTGLWWNLSARVAFLATYVWACFRFRRMAMEHLGMPISWVHAALGPREIHLAMAALVPPPANGRQPVARRTDRRNTKHG